MNSNSASIANDAKRVLREFEIFTETLEDNGSNLDQVSLQLSQFASSLETCERTVSQSRVYQMATVGTIRVIDSLLNEIGYNMQEASDELVTAESYAIGKFLIKITLIITQIKHKKIVTKNFDRYILKLLMRSNATKMNLKRCN